MNNFLVFEDHYGNPVLVNPAHITSVRAGRGSGSWINFVADRGTYVRASVEEVAEALKKVIVS